MGKRSKNKKNNCNPSAVPQPRNRGIHVVFVCRSNKDFLRVKHRQQRYPGVSGTRSGVAGLVTLIITLGIRVLEFLPGRAKRSSETLVMVYYHGPAPWHDTEWKIDSQFTDKAVGWGTLKSAKATLHIRVDLDAGRAEVQHQPFSLAQNNTFLVVHTTDAQQKVIPLGHHNLLKTAENPAAMMLLDAEKSLKQRVQSETGGI